MSEIWEFFDSFCCKFCYKQYSSDILPVFICRNQHYCCKYCLDNFYEVFKIERPTTVFQCPTCKAAIEAQFIKENRKLLEIKEVTLKVIQREKKQESNKQKVSSRLQANEEAFQTELQKKRKYEMKQLKHRIDQLNTQNESLWKMYSEHQHKIKQLQQENTTLGELNRQIVLQVEEKNALLDRVNDLTNINAALEQQIFTLKNKLRKKTSKMSRDPASPSSSTQEKPNFSLAEAVMPEEKVEERRSFLQDNQNNFFRKGNFQAYKLSNDPPIHTKIIQNSEDMNEEEEFVYQSPENNPIENEKMIDRTQN